MLGGGLGCQWFFAGAALGRPGPGQPRKQCKSKHTNILKARLGGEVVSTRVGDPRPDAQIHCTT